MSMCTHYPPDPLHQDPAQRRLPPTPAKPSAVAGKTSAEAGELEPSANATDEENAGERKEERREITNGVADIGAQGKIGASSSREVKAADGSEPVGAPGTRGRSLCSEKN